jgi:hypothetical protein
VVLIIKKKTSSKKRREEFRNKRGGMGVYGLSKSHQFGLHNSGVRGGGKCPEEEHTTCSGGPTILVTSAVYGERENLK